MSKIDVFISHSSGNREAADGVYRTLKGAGISCWISYEDLVGGQKYSSEITRVMSECRVVVLVFSKEASESEWVQSETNMAFSEKKIIMPYRIDKVAIADCGEFRLLLQLAHWIDASDNWQDKLVDLANAVRRALEMPATTITKPDLPPITPKPEPTPAPEPTPTKKEGGSKVMMMIAAVVAVVVVVGVVLMSGGSEDKQPQIESAIEKPVEAVATVVEKPTVVETPVVKEAPQNVNVPAETATTMAGKSAAKSGNSVSAAVVSIYNRAVSAYDKGEYSQAITLFEQAGNAGHVEACQRLVEIYTNGVGNIASNEMKAEVWRKKVKSLL